MLQTKETKPQGRWAAKVGETTALFERTHKHILLASCSVTNYSGVEEDECYFSELMACATNRI